MYVPSDVWVRGSDRRASDKMKSWSFRGKESHDICSVSLSEDWEVGVRMSRECHSSSSSLYSLSVREDRDPPRNSWVFVISSSKVGVWDGLLVNGMATKLELSDSEDELGVKVVRQRPLLELMRNAGARPKAVEPYAAQATLDEERK